MLIVNGRPFFILAVDDPVGFSLGTTDPNPRWPQDYERYFQEAARLGFNTVSPDLVWRQFESLGEDGRPVWDFSLLAQIKALAEAYGLKVIIQWTGSNWAGLSNTVPQYIAENVDDTYQKVLRPDGSVAEDPKLPGGVYAWTWENITRKEATALAKLAEWIRDNDPEQTIIMVAINIEFGIHPNLGTDRSYDALSSRLYDEGGYTDPERFNQDTAQAYFQALTAAFHRVLPGFPLATAAWPGNHGNPYDYLAEWLDRVPDLSLIGPDLYGARLDEVDRYVVGRNAVYVLNQGVNQYAGMGGGYIYCDWPWRIVFPLADAPYNALGIGLYRLVGDSPWGPTTPLFWGLLYTGTGLRSPWFRDVDEPWEWFPWAYYARNSFVGLRAAASRIPEYQGTPRLAAFLAEDFPEGTGTLDLDGVTVRVEMSTPADCDDNFFTYRPGSRGLVIRTGERDFTLVGVDYTATIEADTRAWNLRVERGYWDGNVWKKTGDPLPDTVALDPATGYVAVTLSPDDQSSQDSSQLQYVVRVYDAGLTGGGSIFLPLIMEGRERFEGEINPVWVETWGGPGNERAWDVVVHQNSLYVTGLEELGGASDVFVRKFDMNGRLEWERLWDGGALDAGFVALVSDGYLYVGGKTGDQLGREEGLLLRYDQNGGLLWQRTWGTEDYEEVDGLAILNGTLYASLWSGPVLLGDLDVALLRYDLSGNLLGSAIWEGDWRNEANGHIYVDATGIYVTGGFSQGPGHLDAYLAKFDLNGNYLWHRTWGGDDPDDALNLTSDGDFIYIAGYTGRPWGAQTHDAIVLKYDLEGNLIWSQRWGGSDQEVARGIAVDDRYVWVAAKTKSYGRGGWDVALLKYTKDGTFLGFKLWGGEGDDEPHSLTADANSLYVVGETGSYGAEGKDAFLMKVEK